MESEFAPLPVRSIVIGGRLWSGHPRFGCWMSAAVGAVLSWTVVCGGQEAEGQSPSGQAEMLAPTNASPRQIGANQFALGQVTFDKEKQTIAFPALVNMAEGVIEYALVHQTGKVHESVLKTEVEPYHIHLARLLLAPAGAEPTDVNAPRDLHGVSVSVWVSWRKADGSPQRARLEEMISNVLTKRPMTRGSWVYNGSRVVDGVFLAQRDGSVVTVIADPDAMINNPRPGRNDDEIWRVNDSLVPPVGTPVEVTIQLEPEKIVAP